jgi:hypothetical protein
MKTTVNELISAFHDSISRLIEPLQRVRLLDEKLSGYDGTDAIFETLFREIVENSIRWSLPEAERDEFVIPVYGMHLKDYTDTSYIRVEVRSAGVDPDKELLFIQFVPSDVNKKRLLTVEVSEVDKNGVALVTRQYPFEGCRFVCGYKDKGTIKILDQINVSL